MGNGNRRWKGENEERKREREEEKWRIRRGREGKGKEREEKGRKDTLMIGREKGKIRKVGKTRKGLRGRLIKMREKKIKKRPKKGGGR